MVCAGCEGGNARTPQFLCLPHAHKGARILCGLCRGVRGWVGGWVGVRPSGWVGVSICRSVGMPKFWVGGSLN